MWVKTEFSHDRKLIDQTFLSVFSIKAALFGKGLDCKFSAVSQSLNLIDRGEISFAKFF